VKIVKISPDEKGMDVSLPLRSTVRAHTDDRESQPAQVAVINKVPLNPRSARNGGISLH